MNESTGASAGAKLAEGLPLLERLVREERLSALQHRGAKAFCMRHDVEVVDAIIDSGAMTEAQLLAYLAKVYRIHFVSESKIAQLTIRASTLRLVSLKLAERLCIIPVRFDKKRQKLSVLGGSPANHIDASKQVQIASGVRQVDYIMARPSAIRRAIAQHYEGSAPAPFPKPNAKSDPLAVYHDDLHDWSPYAEDPIKGPEPEGPVESKPPRPQRVALGTIPLPDMPDPDAWAPRPRRPPDAEEAAVQVRGEDYLETVNVLIALAERARTNLRGHSARVAAYTRKLCNRMRLNAETTHAICLTAYLHDLGKPANYHLTALNAKQYDGHRARAKKAYLAPIHMLESAALPDATQAALIHFYECADGTGFPKGLEGSTIPLGARIVALADTYADLTSHEKNPARKQLSGPEAIKVLARFKGTLFDATLVDTLEHLVLGDELKARLLAEKQTILIAEPDPEESLVLEMRLLEQGYEVCGARNVEEVHAQLAQQQIDALITEVDLEEGDGFELLSSLRAKGNPLPVIFVTRRGDRESVTRGLELGAADYVVKPASAEIVVAKVSQAFTRGQAPARGVSGSLSEMALSDVVQILAGGGKSGCLRVSGGGQTGKVFFVDGVMWAAALNERVGPDAFTHIMCIQEGDFEFDPAADPPQRNLHESPEALLLEAMRLIDESVTP